MKALHLLTDKDPLRPVMGYIQVKNNFAYATNGNALIKIPAIEVFGKGLIDESEEIYFEACLWLASKMHKAFRFKREGLYFTAIDNKAKDLGTMRAINAKDFINIGRYPDVDIVMIRDDTPLLPIPEIALDPSLLVYISIAMGFKFLHLKFYGATRGIVLGHKDSGAYAMLMPGLLEYVAKKKIAAVAIKAVPDEEDYDDLL